MRRLSMLAATAFAALCLAAPASQAEFDFADVNTGLPNDPAVPAFPGTKAIWAGTCDLSSASAGNGGVGTAPTIRAHCIDVGDSSLGAPPPSDSPWPAGQEPDWRLDPVIEAGGHPDGTATFWFNYREGATAPAEDVKDIVVKLPPGVVGNPEALPKCSAIASQAVPPDCPASAQVGITTLGFPEGISDAVHEARDLQTKAVYNVEARDTVTAEFLIARVGNLFNVAITARGRTNGDYGIDTLALLIPEFVPLGGQAFTFWGVPWAQEHDIWRIDGADTPSNDPAHVHTGFPAEIQQSYDPSWGPIRPFFSNPTECSGQPLPVTTEVDSWQNPVSRGGSWISATVQTDVLSGCEELLFEPQITLKPTVSVSDSPSGLDVTLATPQNNDPPAALPGNPDLAHDPADDTGAPAYWKTP
ncbi:MAG TPA: hypothetical protein VHF50_03745, partial [Solirubrobacterales bacterium]|nr:hypothetical protein [Solirubrobacterales bacterium]